MRKNLIIKVILLVCLGFFFANYFSLPKDCDLPFRTVVRTTIKGTKVRNLVQKENIDIKRILSIDPSDYEEIRFYKSNDIMIADEFLMVKFKSHNDWDKFRYSVEKHVDKLRDIYQDYVPEEGKKINAYTLMIQGNYGYYYIGEESSSVKRQFVDVMGG